MRKKYLFSEIFLEQRKALRSIVRIALSLVLLAVFVPYVFTITPELRGYLVGIVVFTFVIMFTMLSVIPTLVFAQLRKTFVEIDDNIVYKVFPSRQQKIVIDENTKLKEFKNKKNEILRLTIKTSKDQMTIFGMENMDQLTSEIQKIIKESSIVEKVVPIDIQTNKGRFISLFFGLTMFFICIVSLIATPYASMKFLFLNLVGSLFQVLPLVLGLYLILKRPIYRDFGTKDKRYDYVLGFILLVASLIRLVVLVAQSTSGFCPI